MELELHAAEILAPTDEINDIEVPDTVVGSIASAAIGCIAKALTIAADIVHHTCPGDFGGLAGCRRKFIGRSPVLG